MKRWGSPERDALRLLAELDEASTGVGFMRGVLYAFTSAALFWGVVAMVAVAVTR